MVLVFSGEIDYAGMVEQSSYVAPLFYALYLLVMWCIMLNLFVAIIVTTFDEYRDVREREREQNNTANERHIVFLTHEYLMDKVGKGV